MVPAAKSMYTHSVRILRALGTGFGVSLLAASTAFADVQLTMADGRVTLIATDATVPQILAEWARVGGTTIVNAEKIPGGPVALELKDVPEQQALDVVLRSVSGYVAAPRATFASNLSRFDRIVVMATSVAPRTAVTAPPTAPVAPQPALPQLSAPQAGDQASPFNPFPQPQVAAPQAFPAANPGVFMPAGAGAQPPTRVPTVPLGTAVPGMIPPPPPPQFSASQAGDQASPFNPFPQPQGAAPQAFPAANPGVFMPAGVGAQPPTGVPTVPPGTAVPGMIPPPPPPPPFVSPSEKMLSTGQQSPPPGD